MGDIQTSGKSLNCVISVLVAAKHNSIQQKKSTLTNTKLQDYCNAFVSCRAGHKKINSKISVKRIKSTWKQLKYSIIHLATKNSVVGFFFAYNLFFRCIYFNFLYHNRGTQRGYSSKPLNIALLNVFQYLNGKYRHIFIP